MKVVQNENLKFWIEFQILEKLRFFENFRVQSVKFEEKKY